MEFSGNGELFIDGEPIGRTEGLTLCLNAPNLTVTTEWPDEGLEVAIDSILDADVIDC